MAGPGPDGGLDKLIWAPTPGQAYARLVLRPDMCCLCLRSKALPHPTDTCAGTDSNTMQVFWFKRGLGIFLRV